MKSRAGSGRYQVAERRTRTTHAWAGSHGRPPENGDSPQQATGRDPWAFRPPCRSRFPQTLHALGDNSMIGEEVMASHTEADQLREQLLRAQRLSSVGTLATSVAH